VDQTPRQILTIAGSDPGAGAGIAADLKTIHANGGYGLFVVAALTAQNTRRVDDTWDPPPEVVRGQLVALFDDFEIAAAKTGMLSSAMTIEVVAKELAAREVGTLVVDPVMVSSSGTPLLTPEALARLRDALLPLARVCTPNRHEAEVLSGRSIRTAGDAEEAARRIRDLGPRAVLIKGGHLAGDRASDLLLDGDHVQRFEAARIETRGTHGTGCVLSAAIATHLGRGRALPEAVAAAKRFTTRAIAGRLAIGKGNAPVDPLFFLSRQDWTAFSGGDDAQGG